MSRALSRLRKTTGDPLLVRAGRDLVPTPRALELREQVGQLVQEAEAVLRPVEMPDLKRHVRMFTLRNRDGFVENFGPALVARLHEQAPGMRLMFMPKPDNDSAPLRDGKVDLETGVVKGALGTEIRARALFRDRLAGVVRIGHPLRGLSITLERYAAARHILVSHHGPHRWPIDDALEARGLQQKIAVGGFSEALALARGSDLIASVRERYTGHLRDGLFSFPLPIALPQHTISPLWHPRMDTDPAHRWLRECIRDVCAATKH
jgi:DNA-binding transcriptional LysR family regulator